MSRARGTGGDNVHNRQPTPTHLIDARRVNLHLLLVQASGIVAGNGERRLRPSGRDERIAVRCAHRSPAICCVTNRGAVAMYICALNPEKEAGLKKI